MDSPIDSGTIGSESSLDGSQSVANSVENTSNEGLDENLNQNNHDQQSRNANQSTLAA